MAHLMTFQEICARKEIGFVCDKESVAPLTKRESFNDLVIKLASKCEMNLIFLGGQDSVAHFTIDVVPEDPVHGTAVTVTKSKGSERMEYPKGYEAVASACQQCVANGYHGLHAISKLDISNMPDNASRDMYSFAQFVNFLIHGIEAYFMFVKANHQFVLNAMNLWETLEDAMMDTCYIVMVWQYHKDAKEATIPRKPLTSFINNIKEPEPVEKAQPVQPAKNAKVCKLATPVAVEESKKKVTTTVTKSARVGALGFMNSRHLLRIRSIPKPHRPGINTTTRGRRSIAARVQESSEASTDEEDSEISFKNKPPQIKYHPDIKSEGNLDADSSPKKLKNPSPKRPQPDTQSGSPKKTKTVETEKPVLMDATLDDFTLGFEKPAVKTTGRKSTARKSLISDWPEETKEDILYFFDNLNPSQTEQSRVALSCKYTSMKYSKDLSSKVLYQWVQKKGRSINKELTSYDLPESQQQETTVTFFRSLGSEISETSRIAFTCKFMQTQYGINVTSKNLYDWLNDKGKRSTRRR